MGAKAVELLLSGIRGELSKPRKVLLPPRLVLGSSSRPGAAAPGL
jgi:DNA-binding LacI/PurR family transcriptional regulator